jgi:hypothetical protein
MLLKRERPGQFRLQMNALELTWYFIEMVRGYTLSLILCCHQTMHPCPFEFNGMCIRLVLVR